MIVLDANVIFEIIKPLPDASVIKWLENQLSSTLFITVITQSELLYGAYILNEGKRKTQIIRLLKNIFYLHFSNRLLDFDVGCTGLYAEIMSHRRSMGNPISQFDAMIAAIVKSKDAKLATRNLKDFENTGITLINTWEEANNEKP